MASRLVRADAVTVSGVLDGHKLLEIDCAGRVYLTLPVPGLVAGGQVVNFLTGHEHSRLLRPLAAAGQPQAPPELRQAPAIIDHHVDDYITRARLKPAARKHDSRVQNPGSKALVVAVCTFRWPPSTPVLTLGPWV